MRREGMLGSSRAREQEQEQEQEKRRVDGVVCFEAVVYLRL
jgi:hypothetical protein